jgi:hypothetical protein
MIDTQYQCVVKGKRAEGPFQPPFCLAARSFDLVPSNAEWNGRPSPRALPDS